MSAKLRASLLKELEQKSDRKYRNKIANFFDNGYISLERSKWDIIYHNAKLATLQKQGVITTNAMTKNVIPDKVWKDLFKELQTGSMLQKGRKTGPGGSGNLVRFHRAAFKYSSSKITLPYSRGKDKRGNPYKLNPERRAEMDLRKFMTLFCNSNKFVKPVVKSLTRASQQVYEHGSTGEQDFLNNASSSIETRGVSNAKGGQGTVVDQTVAAALIDALSKAYSTEPWFDSAFEAIYTKWSDVFGYDSDLDTNDRKNSISSTVRFKGSMVPARSSINSGRVDTALREELKWFLGSRDFFVQEVQRLNKMIDAETADKMFSDSPPPSKRAEEIAIKLAAANIADGLNKKYIKKRAKIAKPKANKKRGRPTKASAAGLASSAVRTRKGRVTKQQTELAESPSRSPLALKELINAALPAELLQRMGPPALTNRTGRFRQSAEVTNVNIGPKGGTQIDYTYMKFPYQTFEPGFAQGSTNRDPRKLIGGTIREIAQRITGKKFITTRRR